MKSRKRLAAVIAATSVIAAVLAGLVVSAAALGSGTAKLITSPDVFAGSSGPVTIRVTNPGGSLPPSGSAVNMVVLHPANGFTIQPPPSPAPSGWHYTLSGTDAVFSGSTIAPGSSADFTVPTQVSRPAGNVSSNWQAKSSDTTGRTFVLDTTASPGTMTSTIHVLKVTAAALAAPAGATDNTVTAGQNNTTIAVTVQNGSSGALTVTPRLIAGGGGDSVGTPPAAQSITGNDGTAAFVFPVSFGTPSGSTPRQFWSDANVSGASMAIGAFTPNITVQTADTFAYVAKSLSPTTVQWGARTFSLSVNKSGDPALTIAGSTTTLTFTNGAYTFSIPLGADKAIGAGNGSSSLSFSGTVPTTMRDGVYTTSLHIVGTDGNGAPVTTNLSPESLTIDNTGPGVAPTLTSSTLDKDGKPVVKDGGTLTVGGSVFQQGSNTTLDPNTTVTSCSLHIVSASTATNTPISCSASGGHLSGSVSNFNSGSLPSGNVSVVVDVEDAGHNTGEGTSNAVPIDNVPPTFASAKTKDVNTIIVTMSEPVKGTANSTTGTPTFQPNDWTVNGTAAKAVTFDGDSNPFGTVVTITPQSAFGPNDTPAVAYSRIEPPAFGSVHDAAGNNAPTSASLTAKDGIAPTAPTLSLVDGKAKWNDTNRFYTSSASPSLTLTGLTKGDGVVLYEHLSTGNRTVCKIPPVQGTTGSCNASGWTAETIHKVQGYVGDGTNVTYFGVFPSIVVDHTAPALTSASVDTTARTVTVNVSDLLGSGRDFAVDWQVVGTNGGQQVSYAIASVTAPSPTSRVLHIDSADPNWGSGSVDSVSYAYAGPATDRYADRAGNFLPDGTIAPS